MKHTLQSFFMNTNFGQSRSKWSEGHKYYQGGRCPLTQGVCTSSLPPKMKILDEIYVISKWFRRPQPSLTAQICIDRQGGAGLVYACAIDRGGVENVTFDINDPTWSNYSSKTTSKGYVAGQTIKNAQNKL